MNTVLLIDPAYLMYNNKNDREFSLGLVTLGGYVRKKQLRNCHIEYFTPNMNTYSNFDSMVESIVEAIISIGPDIIGCTTRCDTYPFTLYLLETIKAIIPNIRIILGGPQATNTDIATMQKYSCIDFIIRGEGEETFLELLSHLVESRKDIVDIQGITYRTSQGNVRRTTERSPLRNIEVYPDYQQIYSQSKKININRIEAGRGCPYNCTFCSLCNMWKRNYRLMPIDRIIKLMNEINTLSGATYFVLEHDNLLACKQYSESILNELASLNKHYTWGCSSRIDNIKAIDIDLLKRAGCTNIYFGIETGSPRMQRIYNKNLKLDDVFDTLCKLDFCGIDFTLSFVCGHPLETIEDIIYTVKLSVKCNTLSHCKGIQIHKLSPLAGSKLLEQYSKIIYLDENSISDQSSVVFYEQYKEMIENDPQLFSSFYSFPVISRKEVDFITTKGVELINSFPKTLFYLIENKKLEILQLFDNNDISIILETIKVQSNDSILRDIFEFEFEIYKCYKNSVFSNGNIEEGSCVVYNTTQIVIETKAYVWDYNVDKIKDVKHLNKEKKYIRIWKDVYTNSVKCAEYTKSQEMRMRMCQNDSIVKLMDFATIKELIKQGYLMERKEYE